jgi:DNA repair exonuclease SbcCD ATPase subunit
MSHIQATDGPQQQASSSFSDGAGQEPGRESRPPIASEPERLEKLEHDLASLESRVTIWGEWTATLANAATAEARSREAENQRDSVPEPFIPYLRSSGVPVDDRISALADKQSKLEKELIELGARLRKVEETTDHIKALTKPQEQPIVMEPRFGLCKHSIKTGPPPSVCRASFHTTS